MEPNDHSKAVSIELLDLHLSYLRKDMEQVLKAMTHMATTDDIKRLSDRMDKFVTADEFHAFKAEVKSNTLGSTFSRVMDTVQRIAVTGAAIGALFAAMAVFFKYFDIIKALA